MLKNCQGLVNRIGEYFTPTIYADLLSTGNKTCAIL